MKNRSNLVVLGLMGLALTLRLMNVIPNFSPVVGLTLFGAALLSRKSMAIILPLVFIYASDFVINNTIARSFYPEVTGIVWFSSYMIWTLLSYVLIAGLGMLFLRTKMKSVPVILATIGSSVMFFLITNFGSWLDPKMMYPSGLEGLWLSYGAALPFFRTSLISDLLFSGVLFGSYALINSFFLSEKKSSLAS